MKSQSGTITPSLLIITVTFVVVIYGLLWLLTLQLDFSHRQVAAEEALNIAEAGINYYRWHLAHAPEDFQDGTGQPGKYEHEYKDPQGSLIGKFSLEILPPSNGSSIVTIISTGWTNQYEKVKRTIRAQYGKPSLAKYSFLQNASSWYGSGLTVHGRIHSNNGIRMDGINTSLVTSAKESYLCGSETGCIPPQTKPGVWGSGPGGAQGLWQFPVPAKDFNLISFDFGSMREQAQNNGLYLAPSEAYGYHLKFYAGGNFEVYRVTQRNYYYGYAEDDGCQRRYQVISQENLIGNYQVSQKPIIFAEDYLWVEGTLKGRTTVVAARFPLETNNMSIWITNNLVFAAYDQTNALGLIAQKDIYFSRNIPDNFRVDAALIAQKGKIIRHGYLWFCGSSSQALKNKLTINGTIISYEKSYWNFGSPPSSGFREREITYDAALLYQPPPYFPTSGDYEFISWKEE